jgi:hypothetical protein
MNGTRARRATQGVPAREALLSPTSQELTAGQQPLAPNGSVGVQRGSVMKDGRLGEVGCGKGGWMQGT